MATTSTVSLAIALTTLAANTASAGAISGSFKGIVTSSETGFLGTGNVDGQTATGTFSAVIDTCYFFPDPATPGCFPPLGTIKLTVDVAEFHLRFDQVGPLPYAYVVDKPDRQLLELNPGIDDLTAMSDLSLVGLPAAFITGLDYTTLHPGSVIVADSTVSVGVRQEIFANIHLTSVQMNEVPGPAGGPITLCGVAALAARRSRLAARA